MKKRLRTKEDVVTIDKFMSEHPFSSKEELIKFLVIQNFDIPKIQKTINRRWDYHKQMITIAKNKGFVRDENILQQL